MAGDAAFLTDPAVRTLFAALPGARAVGGCVRDALAGQQIADIDLATPMHPSEVMRALADAGVKSVATGLHHGTITAIVAGCSFEVTTLRRDLVTDGRHAEVEWTDDWREDAARRDFTINAMSMTPAGELFDYFSGVADLRAGRVRFVGSAALRVAEDHLRILRYFRFQARYGVGELDRDALAAISGAANSIVRLSVERVWSELKRILAAPDPAASVLLMQQLGVLQVVLPEGANPTLLTRLCASNAPHDPLLRLAALLTGDSLVLAQRMKLSVAESAYLEALAEKPSTAGGTGLGEDRVATRAPAENSTLSRQRERVEETLMLGPDSSDADVRRALASRPRDVLIGRTWLAGGSAWDPLRQRLAAAEIPVFPLAGRDVLARGIPPGPRVGELLQAVRGWWMDGGCIADAAACRAELARLAAG
jgi:poly(A) polymerase